MTIRHNSGRRRLLAAVSALTGLACTSIPAQGTRGIKGYPEPPYDDSTTIDVGGRASEIARNAYDTGIEYYMKYHGCSRCTVGALQDAVDFIPRDNGLLRGASCLDGGATPTKLANCGAFTGAGLIFGYMCGSHTYGDRGLGHELITALHGKFVEAYGGVLCKDVRTAVEGKCVEVVGITCRWSVEIMIERFGG